MKKFCVTVYLLAMAGLVFVMSGCGSSSDGPLQSYTESSESKRMIFTSSALKRNGKYNLFRGDKVTVQGTNAKYYLAPSSEISRGTEDVTMNLEFAGAVSQDLPFVITEEDGSSVLFAYNPNGTGTDTTSTGVTRWGGGTQKLKYTSLALSGSSVELDESDVIDVVLNSDGTATASGETVPSYDYVWHADPQHPAEYWTLGINGTTELDADAYEDAITSTNNGLYIARDVRYTPNTLAFTTSQTATKDEDTEYVVYYDSSSSAVAAAIAKLGTTYGTEYSTDKYIFATLPMSNGGMGGGGTPPDGGTASGDFPGEPPSGTPGGTPPSGDTRMPTVSSVTAAADTSIAAMSTMTHSASDAYNNPVLHITKAGTYRISGKWHGQIWIEVGAKAQHQVALILNGVEVSCDVAPALVFYKVYKWAENGGQGYDTQSVLAANDLWKNLGSKMISSDGFYDVGAIVEIADGTTNTFTGANTYRLLELCPKLDDDDNPKYTGSDIKIGTDISQQEKMYKLDGAFHSRRTMVIGGGTAGTGRLIITSTTCEGLDSEMHMLIDGGIITVSAPDDGINVNEDYVSVFQMDSGTLTVSSTNADGIDSNGWIAFNGGTLSITAGSQRQNSAGEAGLDAENGVYIYDTSAYTWSAAGSSTGGNTGGNTGGSTGGTTSGDQSGNTNTNTNGTTSGDQSGNTNTNGGTTTYSVIPVTETITTVGDSTFILFPDSAIIETDTEGERVFTTTEPDTFELVHRVNDFGGITVK